MPSTSTCPYAASTPSSPSSSKCPAFKDGCPFDGAATLEEIQSIMASVPSSHLSGDGSYVSGEFSAMMAALHKTGDVAAEYQLPDSDPSKCPVSFLWWNYRSFFPFLFYSVSMG